MPAILPPPFFEVPAIIRVASHAPAGPAATHPASPAVRRTAPTNPGPQPLDGAQGPQIVTPPAVRVPPPPKTTTSSGWKR
jgi:hypothetical protein